MRDKGCYIHAKAGTTTTGRVVMTRGIASVSGQSQQFSKEVLDCFTSYLHGEWGELCEEDRQMNEDAITSGEDRILAAYKTSQGKIYIITEWDRSYTTILFADEY